MIEDRIEREVAIAAPPERVWEIITRAEHIGKWFGESAEIDLRPGGTIALHWAKYGTQFATIEKIDEPRYFSYRWKPGAPGQQPTGTDSTLVEFTLTPQGDRTVLRLVESGFSGLSLDETERAEQFESNSDGWASELRELQEYVERLAA